MAVKRAQSARSERSKLVLVVILGICLGAILLWPEDAGEAAPQSDPGSSRRSFASRSGRPSPRPQSSRPAVPSESPAGADRAVVIAGVELPRLDRDRIAAADPFASLAQSASESSGPEDLPSEALAAAAARASVRAVYRTSRGAAAIVDDQIIPIKDAKHWIATLREAD